MHTLYVLYFGSLDMSEWIRVNSKWCGGLPSRVGGLELAGAVMLSTSGVD